MNPATWDVIASLGGFAGIAALVTAARGLRGVRDQLAPSPPGTAPGTLADNMALLADMVSSLSTKSAKPTQHTTASSGISRDRWNASKTAWNA